MKNHERLVRFGFSFERNGAHSARTMMLAELRELLNYVNNPEAERNDYQRAIVDENCLGKRSVKTRALTFRHLSELYSLDISHLIFRALLYFWNRDPQGQPFLALLCTYARDPIFRMSAPFLLEIQEGRSFDRGALEQFIDNHEPGRFSQATLTSITQNIAFSWTQTGHLKGRRQRTRERATPTPGSISYALLLGYLRGERGLSLFHTEYVGLLDCSTSKALELAEISAKRGWIIFKRIGDVIEVLFPNLIHQEEMEWIREQD